MHLSWLGTSAVKIQTKPADKDVVVVIDPYKPATGTFPRSLTPDICLYTRGTSDSITISGNPFVLSTPGECETKDVLITMVQGHDADTAMVRIDAEDVSIGHLGLAGKPLTNAQLDLLSGVDILFVPIGAGGSYDTEAAAKAVAAIEPRIVIPVAFRSDNDPKTDDAKAFLKEMGATDGVVEKKVIIKKKDLPQEETRVILLAKE